MENQEQDWICTFEWVPITFIEGAWSWTLYRIEDGPELHKLADGISTFRWPIYFKVWRVCRKHGIKFRPWSKGWESGVLDAKS